MVGLFFMLSNIRLEISSTSINFIPFEYFDKFNFHFHFVHKKDDLSHLKLINDLCKTNKNFRFTCNLSLKHVKNYLGTNNIDFIIDTVNLCIKKLSRYDNISDVLIISGSKSKIFIHDLILRLESNIPIGVAYNSFFNKEYERYKLNLKLSSHYVKYVYFQIGEDIKIIQDEVLFIKKHYPEIDIILSIIFPTPFFLARFKFRPWSQIVLSKKYLNDLEYAKSVFAKQINFCIDHDIKFILVGDVKDIIKHYVK